MSCSYNTPCIKHKIVVSIYPNTETSLVMSTLAIWCRIFQSRDVRSRVFSRPTVNTKLYSTEDQSDEQRHHKMCIICNKPRKETYCRCNGFVPSQWSSI